MLKKGLSKSIGGLFKITIIESLCNLSVYIVILSAHCYSPECSASHGVSAILHELGTMQHYEKTPRRTNPEVFDGAATLNENSVGLSYRHWRQPSM